MPADIFPQFELVGPPCLEPGCKGKLIDCMSLRTHMWFRKCSVCAHESSHTPAEQKLEESIQTIERILILGKN